MTTEKSSKKTEPEFHEQWVVENRGIGELINEYGARELAAGLDEWADWLDENG